MGHRVVNRLAAYPIYLSDPTPIADSLKPVQKPRCFLVKEDDCSFTGVVNGTLTHMQRVQIHYVPGSIHYAPEFISRAVYIYSMAIPGSRFLYDSHPCFIHTSHFLYV